MAKYLLIHYVFIIKMELLIEEEPIFIYISIWLLFFLFRLL